MVKIRTIAPASAVVNTIAMIGELLSENIITSDKQDINVIPEDKPSNPSIRFIALVIPTIHPTVKIYVNIGCMLNILSIKSILILLILIPHATITHAEITCPTNLTIAGNPLTSSI